MQSIHEGAVDEICWPDHRGGLHEERPHETGNTKSETLSGQSQKDAEAPAYIVLVEYWHNRSCQTHTKVQPIEPSKG